MIALASDHLGVGLKQEIIALLEEMRLSYEDFGAHTGESCDYPIYAARACRAVLAGQCQQGILICGTGVGIGLAANKMPGIRCVMCSEPYSAVLSRRHNDSNMLALGVRVVGAELAKMIARMWLTTDFEGAERHRRRMGQIAALERGEAIE